MSDKLDIFEVGPRDGLQNEKTPVSTDDKVRFIHALAQSGLREIEATSFVSAKWVPQLGDAEVLWPQLSSGAEYVALVPNVKGLERAHACGVNRIALFTAASDAFTQKNINMSIDQSLDVFKEAVELHRAKFGAEGWVRAYISTAFQCPYAGLIPPSAVVEVAQKLEALGVDEIAIGDTIGVAVSCEVRALARALRAGISAGDRVAWHFHDTNGTAIANVAEAIEHGYRRFDASAAGMGGCPYAPGAGGNLATEDLVYFAERTGLSTGVDLDQLVKASEPILSLIGHSSLSKARLRACSRQPSH